MHLTKIDFDDAKAFAKAHNYLDFLKRLGNPCFIETPTTEKHNPIVIVTLLHGNEVSGLKAIHTLLRDDFVFHCPVVFIIGSVSAAVTEPVFTHRMLPGQKDLNRCFLPDAEPSVGVNPQSILANAITHLIRSYAPRYVVDIHNTSGSGPAFAVIAPPNGDIDSSNTDDYLALASYFSERVIITDIRLGALMEWDFSCPIITFEAGGTHDSQSDHHAKQGITNLLNADKQDNRFSNIEVLTCPRRVMLRENCTLIYTQSEIDDVDLCLRTDIEHLNFTRTPAHTHIGWVNNDIDTLLMTDKVSVRVSEVFYVKDNRLYTKTQLIMFMITTRADIASTDCLFYFSKSG
ncbi:MAG: succinylglutamate desuccinylase/aspartoacylase family protein [Pseudomonadota bacterium]